MIHFELCHYCRIKKAKKEAKKKNWKITKLRAKRGPQGITVYCHPESINIKKIKGLGREPYYVAFYIVKPLSCCCC